jgi:hypothetical protein
VSQHAKINTLYLIPILLLRVNYDYVQQAII